ncbi:hypothetical protein PENANT_c009G07303 [Penicillium antarcticum]|uniref:WW domain-containing protein n=1 Tax=Penicillium antarcticum TaxID=416450 RepID=A0A1V6Q9B3_9EURO|nr:hypothetical protein PENANT_c009G07303 [Penicillium antarcticum]
MTPGFFVYLYATPTHGDAIPILLLEIQNVLLQRYTADKSSMPMAARYTVKDSDGKDVWHEFKRDLLSCGFRGENIVQHHDDLRNHLYELRRSFNDKSLDITIFQVNASCGQSPRSGGIPKPRKVSVHLELQSDGTRANGDQAKPKVNQNTEQPCPAKPKRYNVNGKIVEMGDSTQDSPSQPELRTQRERRTRQPFRPASPSGWSSAPTAGSRASMKDHQRPFVHNYKPQASPDKSNPTTPGQFPGTPIDPRYPKYTFQPTPNPYITPPNGYPPPGYYTHTYQTTPMPMPYFQTPPPPSYAYGASFQYPQQYAPYQPQYQYHTHDNTTTSTPEPTPQAFPPNSNSNFNFNSNQVNPKANQPLLQLTYEKLPPQDLHPLNDLPTLPEGWDWRIDNKNRLFYVDTYVDGPQKRCFWKPPIQEPDEEILPVPGWERTVTLYGRIFWTHTRSKIVSYEFPLSCSQFRHTPTWELYLGLEVDTAGDGADGIHFGNATSTVNGSPMSMGSNYQRASVEDITEEETDK